MRKFLLLGSGLVAFLMLFSYGATGEIFTILDENVDDVLGFLTEGQGTAEKATDAYSGKEALKVIPTGSDGQKYNPAVPDWAFEIVENPTGANQFRYITFAWRKEGGEGFQLQLHGNPDTWGHRYHAGQNVKGWNPSIQARNTIPTAWDLTTQDLFADWGAFTLTGVAFSAWDGDAGYWDVMMLHQTPDEPDAVESAGKLATTWSYLKTQ